jgi:hypothetical protein
VNSIEELEREGRFEKDLASLSIRDMAEIAVSKITQSRPRRVPPFTYRGPTSSASSWATGFGAEAENGNTRIALRVKGVKPRNQLHVQKGRALHPQENSAKATCAPWSLSYHWAPHVEGKIGKRHMKEERAACYAAHTKHHMTAGDHRSDPDRAPSSLWHIFSASPLQADATLNIPRQRPKAVNIRDLEHFSMFEMIDNFVIAVKPLVGCERLRSRMMGFAPHRGRAARLEAGTDQFKLSDDISGLAGDGTCFFCLFFWRQAIFRGGLMLLSSGAARGIDGRAQI